MTKQEYDLKLQQMWLLWKKVYEYFYDLFYNNPHKVKAFHVSVCRQWLKDNGIVLQNSSDITAIKLALDDIKALDLPFFDDDPASKDEDKEEEVTEYESS
jgi:hypothetical protein